MKPRIETTGLAGIVHCAGTLTVQNVDAFRTEADAWMNEHPDVKNLILDLKELDMLDSSGLGGILAVSKQISLRGGEMKLAVMGRKVRLVFEITKADSLFDIHDSVEAALDSFEAATQT